MLVIVIITWLRGRVRNVVNVCQLRLEPLESAVAAVVDHDGQDEGTEEDHGHDPDQRGLVRGGAPAAAGTSRNAPSRGGRVPAPAVWVVVAVVRG